MTTFERDGIQFHYRDSQIGQQAFIFQHGLGGNSAQPFEAFSPPDSIRLLCMDSRAHGDTRYFGDVERLNFKTFAEDVIALLDHLDIAEAIVGGISMGAGIALHIALAYPERVRGLVLSRPAWLNEAMPAHQTYQLIHDLIQQHGLTEGKRLFEASTVYQSYLQETPAVAQSLLGQFDQPHVDETYPKFKYLAQDAPFQHVEALQHIKVPTLILLTQHDPIHPYALGQRLAQAISQAESVELVAKSINKQVHLQETKAAIDAFFARHFRD